MASVDERVAFLEGRVNEQSDAGVAAQDHRFAWLVGIQLTTTAAVVGTLLAALLVR